MIFFPGLVLAGCLATCTIIELLSMWNLTRIEVQLCNILSPEAPPMSLASYNWCLVSLSFSLIDRCYLQMCNWINFLISNWAGVYCNVGWQFFVSSICIPIPFLSVYQLVGHSVPFEGWEDTQGIITSYHLSLWKSQLYLVEAKFGKSSGFKSIVNICF